MSRCRWFNTCPLVQPEGHTCNCEDEAQEYCGRYEVNELEAKGPSLINKIKLLCTRVSETA